MSDIDEERLQTLMELVNKEHPDLDPYVIWVICVNYSLNEQGIYGHFFISGNSIKKYLN